MKLRKNIKKDEQVKQSRQSSEVKDIQNIKFWLKHLS